MYDNLITSDHLEQVVQKIQDTKASKSTTLSGYGITDSYTKTETDNRIQDIVGAAPEALDTLEEIAEALQDGESTAAGLVQTLSQKADKSTTVTTIAYGSKKLTKTINGSTTDVVTINAIKSDLALTKSDVGLSNVDNTSDANKPVSNATQTALDTKVDKVSGKGLSTNDYTTSEKNKLSGIASNAQVNIIESIKVNNSVLPISSKAVNITVPTKTSELTNNSNFAVDSNYVHTDNNYTTAEKQKLASKVAELDSNGKVLSSQLPSYVDDVLEYTSLANFPTTGESGKIYVDTGANLTYRWTGSAYREISPSLALGETGSTAYRGDRGKVAYTHATDSNRLTTAKTSGLYKISTTAEGHVASAETATKSDIGLGNVDNTSDLDKPISTATQEALNTKVNATTSVLKSDEEFTYRQTGGGSLDIDAKYGKLKSIKGRTLVWNQLAKSLQSAWAPGVITNTITFTDSAIRITGNADNISNMCAAQYINTISGHKYYVRYDVMSHNVTGEFYAGYFVSPTQWFGDVTISEVDKKVTYSNIIDANNDRSRIMFGLYRHGTGEYFSTGDYVEYSNIMFIDLTLMFGSNEPSTAAEFETMYPGPYYAYTPGNLINNGKQSEYNLVFNQKITPQVFTMATGSIISSFSASANGSYAITLDSAAPDGVNTGTSISNFFTAGHKYYLKNNSSNLDYLVLRSPAIGDFNEQQQILAIASDWDGGSNNNIRIRFKPNTPAGDYTIRPWVVDLTLMFGAGNEPATPEEFETMFPANYYTYDAGTQVHYSFTQFKTAIETVGWNAFDESTFILNKYRQPEGQEQQTAAMVNRRCSDVFFPCYPNTSYYVYSDLSSVFAAIVCWYDATKVYISGAACANSLVTSPSNARFFRVSSASPTCKVCISLSDPSRNGTYEPYWRSELELGLGDIKVKSHNLWDEEWEVGAFNTSTGEKSTATNTIRSKNYIPVLPNTTYYASLSPKIASVYYYDSNKAFISFDYNSSGTRTTPANCYYMMFVGASSYGTTYNHDICINLSDPAYNGRYEPYGDGGVISITGGLKSAGAVYDEIVGNKAIKRIGAVDMGTLAWTKQTNYFGVPANSFILPHTPSTSSKPNILCIKYKTGTPNYVYVQNNKGITVYTNGSLVIVDPDHDSSTVATFVASLSGVILYYELAQPIEYELYNPIDLSYKVDKFGTEKLLPESTSAIVSSPFRADIEYRTTNVTIDDVYGGSDIIKSVEDVDSRLTTVEKSINGLVTIGSGSPTTIPKNIGDFYIDVTNKVLYFATGNQLISDWNS